MAEQGAFDGVHQSNTNLFLQKGFRGLLVEPDNEAFKALRGRYHTVTYFVGLDREDGRRSLTFKLLPYYVAALRRCTYLLPAHVLNHHLDTTKPTCEPTCQPRYITLVWAPPILLKWQ